MDKKNLESLTAEMLGLGFGEDLIAQMEARMADGEPRFILYDKLESDKGRMEVGLHFNQSKSSDYYYFNKFDLVLEKQPELAEGEKYFVVSQRQGEQGQVKAFEMASLAVRHFDMKLQGAKEIRGTAQLLVGQDAGSARQLAGMVDGKVNMVEKDFYKTLMDPSASFTVYLEKGNGFTLQQAANMLAGRAVFRDNILNIQKNQYSAWAKLDFDAGRDKGGNFPLKTFTENYGFELGTVLDRFDFKELAQAAQREAVEVSLRNGNMTVVSTELDGVEQKVKIVAVPEFKQLNIYDMEGKSVKRETYQKQEQLTQVDLEKDKNAKKELGQGLAV